MIYQLGYVMSILLAVCTTIYFVLYHYAHYIYKKIPDDKLNQDPPPKEDCPICMLPMPFAFGVCGVETLYMSCCGKLICTGCALAANEEMSKGNMKKWCPYCRVRVIGLTDEENLKRLKHRTKLNDAEAFYHLGIQYRDGGMGLPPDRNTALMLMNQAAELGSIEAHAKIAVEYEDGIVEEEQEAKTLHHLKLAAMGGHEVARFLLGLLQCKQGGNMYRAKRHFMIAARSGYDEALKYIREGYKAGNVTKDEYAATLRAYQHSCDEMKSDQRDIAAERRES